MSDSAIKTPETHPDDPVVGKYFKAYDGRKYYCDSYDPSCGYWMTTQEGELRRTCVSERAIGRTFHEA
jgi:hypothetical protein